MATQLQRALGLASGKEAVPKAESTKGGKREGRSEKKGDPKADPYANLPRRQIGVDAGS